MLFRSAPTEEINAARRTAEPPMASRLRHTSRRGDGCFRCRPRVREGRVRYPELVTKVAPVMQLRALAVRNILHDNTCTKTGGRGVVDPAPILWIPWVICQLRIDARESKPTGAARQARQRFEYGRKLLATNEFRKISKLMRRQSY